ncbi:MAG: InlB B-repeat-containing protein [Spirochaetaceae bacterium]|nr:InlB B-repeat-containing protein [Spirochaetaceae bacterium]
MRRSGFVSVVGGSLLVLVLVLGACRTEISSGPGGGSQGSPSGGNPSAEGDQVPGDQVPGDQVPGDQVPGDQPAEEEIPSTPAARFFWGTWIRMDNGAHYKVYEDTVTQEDGGAIYYVSPSSTTERMVVSGLGTFTKESDSVIMNGSIPYFRKGGANPSYRMRLVGFVGGPSRAAATTIHGWKVTGTSGSYPTYTNTSKSDENGEFTLTAPVVGDTQTVTVSTDSGVIVVPGLTIENSGDFMGTIPLVDSGDYILKITGSIAQEEKLDGYLYGNSYKRYPMTLTITNVSQVKSAMSVCVVENDDPNLSITSSYDLAGVPISTLAPGATKTIDLEVSYGHLTEPYVDTEIKVRITNAQTGNEWVDYVPLRFFRGQVPLTVAAVSTEGNHSAALNGFLVHPDGQSQFFSVPHGGSSTIYSPTFPNNQPYLMAFSGATVTGTLSDSTEMFYTVAVGDSEPVEVKTGGSGILGYMTFGEPNESEKQAYPVNGNFQSYLSEGEIDYFSVTSDTWELVSIAEQCTISYNSDGGGVVQDKKVYKGTRLNIYHLPILTKEGYDFDGWYSGGTKIESGYQVQADEFLTARWKIHQYTVSYSTERGSAPAAKTYDYNTALSASDLPQLSQYGYTFGGWYSGNTKITEGHRLTAPLSLTAQWIPVKYTVSYNTEHGSAPAVKTYDYNTTLGTAGLPSLTATGYTHTGWQVEGVTATAGYVVTENVTLTATWEIQRYTVNYTTAHGSKPAAKTYDYNTALSAEDLPQLSQYGYTFGGWYSGSTKIEAGHKLTAPLSLTAQWTPVKYTVRYSTERGGTVEDKPYDYNTTLGTAGLPRLTATGYTHTGWQVEGKTATADYVVTNDVILTATWKIQRYTVNYTTAHDSKPDAKTYDYNTALSAEDLPQLSQYGYTFGGWYSGSTKIEVGHKLTAPLSLTAQWTPVKYTVRYSTERGGTVEDKPYDYNTTLGTAGLPRLTATGYTHTGWQVEGVTATAGYVVTGEVTLTATWTPNTNTRYTVRHHQQNVTGEGYTLVSGDTEAKTGTTDATTAAAAKSYTGFTAKGITQETIAPDGSTVVDVFYDRKIINLTLDLDGGSTTTALSGGMLSGRYGAPVSLVAPTKSGWHFTGWNTSGGTLPTTFTGPGTYKALWTGAGVSVTVAPVSDIQVRQHTDGTTVTLTADAGYTSYQWKVDGVVQNGQTSKVLELDTSSWVTGTYEVFLLVQDGGLYKSASLRITK